LKEFESGLGSDDLIEAMTAPPFVWPIGMAGGFLRLGGAGGGLRRGFWDEDVLSDATDVVLRAGEAGIEYGDTSPFVTKESCLEGRVVSESIVALLFLAPLMFEKSGRLGTLALLGRRTWSRGDRSGGFGKLRRVLVRFSTLLLCFNDFGAPLIFVET
jgi:hypothetical protein